MDSNAPLYMIPFREAQRILKGKAISFGTEEVPLGEADGRVLADPVRADRDYPPFNRATMDGYALNRSDLGKDIRRFEIIETIYAGAGATLPFRPGTCYKIMTGAPVPQDVDLIIRREDTLEEEGYMEIRPPANPGRSPEPAPAPASPKPAPGSTPAPAAPISEPASIPAPVAPAPGAAPNPASPAPADPVSPTAPAPASPKPAPGSTQAPASPAPAAPISGGPASVSDLPFPDRPFLNIARQGEDMLSGQPIIDEPCLCTPSLIGLLASLGKKELTVQKLPKLALITTGNEVVPVDAPVSPVQIRNSNRWLLQSLLQKWHITPSFYAHAPDDKPRLRTTIKESLTADVVLLCGGVSAGDADYVPEVLGELGVDCLFHKLAIKPGKPVWCGTTPKGGLVIALPGNPFSCLTGFVLLIEPWLQACFGLKEQPPLGLPLATAKKKKTPLDEFFPVRISGSPAQLLPVTLNGSGDIRLGMQANALALHPSENGDLAPGTNLLYFGF